MYSFFGLFADPLPALERHWAEMWSGIRPLLLDDPLPLWGMRFSEAFYASADEDIPEAVSADVARLSTDYPTARFLLLRTECWGGACGNWGEIIRAGEVIRREQGDGALGRLVRCFDIDLGPREIFGPLRRTFPWPV